MNVDDRDKPPFLYPSSKSNQKEVSPPPPPETKSPAKAPDVRALPGQREPDHIAGEEDLRSKSTQGTNIEKIKPPVPPLGQKIAQAQQPLIT